VFFAETNGHVRKGGGVLRVEIEAQDNLVEDRGARGGPETATASLKPGWRRVQESLDKKAGTRKDLGPPRQPKKRCVKFKRGRRGKTRRNQGGD